MASDAQICANRANAALSTGPRSEEGKARAARNALVHGGCASVLLPDEDADTFEALRCAYEEQYCPADQTEQFFVDRLAMAAWRLHRLVVLEARVVCAQQERAADAGDFTDPVAHAYIRDSERGDSIGKLARYQTSLERSFYRALQQLERRRPS